jgi:ssDNA-binding Zn-finger/Zn-ribbon topoisomerase 1
MKKLILLAILIIGTFMGCSDNPSKTVVEKKAGTLKKAAVIEPADFDVFFKKFKGDSVYQKEHINFPIKITVTEDERDSVTYIKKDKWQYVRLTNNKKDIYKKAQSNKNSVTIQYTVEDTGILMSFDFTYIEGKWRLTSATDSSD